MLANAWELKLAKFGKLGKLNWRRARLGAESAQGQAERLGVTYLVLLRQQLALAEAEGQSWLADTFSYTFCYSSGGTGSPVRQGDRQQEDEHAAGLKPHPGGPG